MKVVYCVRVKANLMQEINCWLNIPQIHWIHHARPCSQISSCMQPSCWLVVLAEWHPRSQVANEGHCSTEARVPARESWAVIAGICHQLHKLGKVDLSNLQTVDHGLHGTVPHWSRQHSSLLSWLKLSVCEDQILFYFPTITEWINWKSLPLVWLWWSSLVSAQSSERSPSHF